MAYSHQNVTLRGFHFEDFSLTVNLAAGIVAADVGKALSWDTTGPNKMKLAADGEEIVARLATVENRTVEGTLIGAAEFRFSNTLPIKAGQTVAVGAKAVGAGAGEIKAAGAGVAGLQVVEILGNFAVVSKL